MDDTGSVASCQLASPGALPGRGLPTAARPELLTGIAGLLESRRLDFGALFAAYDLDGDGKLDSPELEALAADALGPDAGGVLRYFQVGRQTSGGERRQGWAQQVVGQRIIFHAHSALLDTNPHAWSSLCATGAAR